MGHKLRVSADDDPGMKMCREQRAAEQERGLFCWHERGMIHYGMDARL